MSTKRNELFSYYIKKVIKFCEEFSKWKHAREKEMRTMMDIKDRADKISQCERKKLPKMTADWEYEDLEKEFDKALAETLKGLDNLRCFLGAVEKLKFFPKNEMLHFPEEINFEYVQTFFAAAHLFHPQLLEFEADVKNLNIRKPFEDPKLQNVEAMKYELNRYIETSEKIFDCLGKSFISKACLKMETVDDQNMEWPEDSKQHMFVDIDENRKKLQEALCHYTTDTLTYIKEVIKFCEKFSKWKSAREEEMKTMMDIKVRADKLNMNFSHVSQAENKGKAFLKLIKSKLPKTTADNRREELEKELDKVLTETLEGLENLSSFLDAVAKLAVTSVNVFTENQLLQLPEITLEHVQIIITAARLFCPLLLVFKTDAKLFFVPKLPNVEVLKHQLDIYIQTSEKIFECFGKSFISKARLSSTVEDQNVYCSVDDIDHINHFNEIRLDPDLRMVLIFQEESCSHFINEFNKHKSEMLQFLNELEQCVVQLDNMDKGAKISSVAGSSVGAVGGVLSVVGLALAPFTAGVSLALTVTGVSLGVTSAVNSAVTTGTEIGVNVTQQKKVNEIFQKFMMDVQELQNCLLEAASKPASGVEIDKIEVALGAGRIAAKVGTIGKGIDSLVDGASAFRLLRGGKGLRNASRVASDIPDIGQAVVKAPIALSKTIRGLFIAGNVLFVGMDIFFICKDSKSLAKGRKTEVSQFVRARTALLRLEFDSWQKIHESLNEGLNKLEEKRAILEKKSSD